MFFNKPNIILFLDRNKLTVYESGGKQSLEIPPSISSFLTILNPEEYRKVLAEFLQSFNFNKEKAVLILAKNITFAKKIDNNEDFLAQKESFFHKVPLDEILLAKVKINYGDTVGLITGSAGMFEPVVEEAKKNGLEIVSVVPAIVYENLNTAEELTEETASQVLNNNELLEQANFKSEVTKQEEKNLELEKTSDPKVNKQFWYKSKRNRVLLIVTVLLFFTAGSLTVYSLRSYLPFLKPQQTRAVVQSAEPSPTASASAEVNFISKQDLKIEIYNGTGIANQAAKVKASLLKLGFNNIDTANVEGTGDKDTIFLSKLTVDAQSRNEILNELKKTFSNVALGSSPVSSKYDIEITTGKLK